MRLCSAGVSLAPMTAVDVQPHLVPENGAGYFLPGMGAARSGQFQFVQHHLFSHRRMFLRYDPGRKMGRREGLTRLRIHSRGEHAFSVTSHTVW